MKCKKILPILILALFAFFSCEKDGDASIENQISYDSDDIENLTSTNLVLNNGCNGTVSGSFSTIGQYHRYPNKQIDVSCAAIGSNITVQFVSNVVPNRFVLRSSNGTVIKNTGWMGDVNFPGPWGSSLNNQDAPQSVTFTKTSNVYTLEIETVTSPINQRIDQWSVSYLCTCSSDDNGGGDNPTTCNDDCGDTYGGSFNQVSTYYIYPARTLDVKCVGVGQTISVFVNPADVPNRFRIKDANGNSVVSSNWLGTANYPGPWGFNLFMSATNLTFQKSANSDFYTLEVETATPPNQFDSWSATLNCQ